MTRILSIFLFLFVFPHQVFGASLSFRAVSSREGGDVLGQARIEVLLESNQNINAVEGTILIPELFASQAIISSGNSVVNFWVENPHYAKEKKGITFSGIIPGGVSGESRILFSFALPEDAYTANTKLVFDKATLFLNDGEGSSIIPESQPLVLTKQTVLGDGYHPKLDTEPPEAFVPTIGRDQNIFDGAYFVVFATTDKGSGVQRYEIKEGLWSFYHEVVSPYRLSDQGLHKNISIRAIDQAGNIRTVDLLAQNGARLWEESRAFGILIGGIAIYLIIVLCRKLFK